MAAGPVAAPVAAATSAVLQITEVAAPEVLEARSARIGFSSSNREESTSRQAKAERSRPRQATADGSRDAVAPALATVRTERMGGLALSPRFDSQRRMMSCASPAVPAAAEGEEVPNSRTQRLEVQEPGHRAVTEAAEATAVGRARIRSRQKAGWQAVRSPATAAVGAVVARVFAPEALAVPGASTKALPLPIKLEEPARPEAGVVAQARGEKAWSPHPMVVLAVMALSSFSGEKNSRTSRWLQARASI